MKDLSGNGNHATQTSAGAKPTYPGLSYDGVDDMFDLGAPSIGSTGLFAGSGDAFGIAVAIVYGSDVSSAHTVLSKATGDNADRTFQLFVFSGSLYVNFRGSSTEISAGVSQGQRDVVLIAWDGQQPLVRVNGSEVPSVGVGTQAETQGENIVIGAKSSSSPVQHWVGDIGRMLMRDSAWGQAEIDGIESYLET